MNVTVGGNNGVGTMVGCFFESIWSLGRYTGTFDPIDIISCTFKLIGNKDTDGTTVIPVMDMRFEVGNANFVGGFFGQFTNGPTRESIRNIGRISFDGTTLNGYPQLTDETMAVFRNVKLRTTGGLGPIFDYLQASGMTNVAGSGLEPQAVPGAMLVLPDRMYRARPDAEYLLAHSGAVTVTVPVPADGTAAFTTTTALAKTIMVGDSLKTITDGAFMGLSCGVSVDMRKQLIGVVTSVDTSTGVVNLTFVPHSLVTGTYTAYQIRLPRVKPVAYASFTSGSVNATIVAGTAGFGVNQRIASSALTAGTFCTTGTSGITLVLSAPATTTGTFEVRDAWLEMVAVRD